MFDVAPTEFLLVAVVALLVIGPKDLPRLMRTVGQWVGRARGVARHFRSGFDTMMREAELEELEKKWREENERIMRDYPLPAPDRDAPMDDPGSSDVEVNQILPEAGEAAPQLPFDEPADSSKPRSDRS